MKIKGFAACCVIACVMWAAVAAWLSTQVIPAPTNAPIVVASQGVAENAPKQESAWRRGPLPPNTFQWGGVMLVGDETTSFHFADFCGDHVKILDARGNWRRVEPDKVAYWNNALTLPLPKELRD